MARKREHVVDRHDVAPKLITGQALIQPVEQVHPPGQAPVQRFLEPAGAERQAVKVPAQAQDTRPTRAEGEPEFRNLGEFPDEPVAIAGHSGWIGVQRVGGIQRQAHASSYIAILHRRPRVL